MKEMVTPAAERKAVAHLVEKNGMSERRACKAVRCSRITIRYQSIRPDDAALRERMRTIARERRRFGYRRLHVMLKHEGLTVNHKKLFRLDREEKLSVRRRGGRKRAIGTRAPMLVPLRPNERWSVDPRVKPDGMLRLRPVHRWAIGSWNAIRFGSLWLPRARDRRRLHAQEPGSGGRYIAIRRARCPGA